jgi:molybdenum cofactor biosynthesis protein B
MVDFQSRDTNRGYGSDDDEEADDTDEMEAEAEADPDVEVDSDTTADPAMETGQEESEPQESERTASQRSPDARQAERTHTERADTAEPTTAGGESTMTGGETTAVGSETNQSTAGVDNADATSASPPEESTDAGSQAGASGSQAVESSAYAVVTITNERSLSEDDQGDAVVEAIEGAADRVLTRDLIRSDYDNVQSAVSTLAERDDIDVVVTIGGTGVEPSDVTAEALEPLFEKELPGFGELFRLLAHETEGTAVVGARVTAGIVDRTPVFALPGTVTGVELGMAEIVLPEARHLVADASAGER